MKSFWCWLFHGDYRCPNPRLLAMMRECFPGYPECIKCADAEAGPKETR